MRGLSLAVICLCVAGCADSPTPSVAHGKSLGPCQITFDHVADAWYVIIQREPSSSDYASGAFVAEFTVFPRPRSKAIRLWATPTEDRILIPGFGVFNPGSGSCEAYEPLLAAVPGN